MISIFLLFIIFILISLLIIQKNKPTSSTTLKNWNQSLSEERLKIFRPLMDEKGWKDKVKSFKKDKKSLLKKGDDNTSQRAFYLEFSGDVQGSSVGSLSHAITLLQPYLQKEDEVIIKIESPGGAVSSYGLAASEMLRLRERISKLTVCIDKIAASGGYLMASVAHHIVAAPFAIVGSIGVVSQVPNFRRFLQDKNIDVFELTAGKNKRTLSLLGEVTEDKKEQFQEQLDRIHHLFKSFVSEFRPQMDLTIVANGDFWLAREALPLNLVDEIKTSQDYLMDLDKTIYFLEYNEPKGVSKILKKLMQAALNYKTLLN
jgi:serine protease SohB